jgi:hypothetical protein
MKPDRLSTEKKLDFVELWKRLDQPPPGPITQRPDPKRDTSPNPSSQ